MMGPGLGLGFLLLIFSIPALLHADDGPSASPVSKAEATFQCERILSLSEYGEVIEQFTYSGTAGHGLRVLKQLANGGYDLTTQETNKDTGSVTTVHYYYTPTEDGSFDVVIERERRDGGIVTIYVPMKAKAYSLPQSGDQAERLLRKKERNALAAKDARDERAREEERKRREEEKRYRLYLENEAKQRFKVTDVQIEEARREINARMPMAGEDKRSLLTYHWLVTHIPDGVGMVRRSVQKLGLSEAKVRALFNGNEKVEVTLSGADEIDGIEFIEACRALRRAGFAEGTRIEDEVLTALYGRGTLRPHR